MEWTYNIADEPNINTLKKKNKAEENNKLKILIKSGISLIKSGLL